MMSTINTMFDGQHFKVEKEEFSDEPGTSGTVPCLVCGRGTNTGHHYGVQSCLGCKTFFRRIVLKRNQPKCKYDGSCKLEKGVNQKRICRSCRLQRCFDIGMTEKALHPCRDAIGKRRRSPRSRSGSASPTEISPLASPGSSSGPSTTNAYSPDAGQTQRAQAALGFLQSVRDGDIVMRARLSLAHGHTPADNPEDFYAIPPLEVLLSRLSLNASIGDALKVDLILIREWVSLLVPLSTLNPESKKGLISQFCLKHTILEHGLLTQRIPFLENVWFYGDLSCYLTNFDSIPEPIRVLITPPIQAHHSLLQPLFRWLREEIVTSLDRLKPSTTEVAAIKLISLLSREGTFLEMEERILVEKLRDEVLLGLHHHYISQNNPNVAQRIGELLMFCGTLSLASHRGREQLRMLQFFDRGGFDPESYDQLFPTT
ncbi:unnamed protein product, partial [Mesorhabditis belari]|uniref:Uncharacterized protein n=1 Tax=Mesorhabditis belari TaxID=2138241 RepID=A0AAF3FR85_9BILA